MTVWRNRILFFVVMVLAWEGVVRLHVWPRYLVPSPLSVGAALAEGLRDGTYGRAILASLGRVAVGYGLSLGVGIPLGLALGRSKVLQDTVGSVMLGLQALPSICWLPLALLWFGLSPSAITFVVVMGALLSVTLSTADGVRNTPPLYLRAARTMGSRGLDMYVRVVVPAALPSIVSGMKLGWSFAWRSLMAGELIYFSVGLGQLLTMGRELNDMAQVISVMLVIICIGLAIDRAVFAPVESRLRERWGLARG